MASLKALAFVSVIFVVSSARSYSNYCYCNTLQPVLTPLQERLATSCDSENPQNCTNDGEQCVSTMSGGFCFKVMRSPTLIQGAIPACQQIRPNECRDCCRANIHFFASPRYDRGEFAVSGYVASYPTGFGGAHETCVCYGTVSFEQ